MQGTRRTEPSVVRVYNYNEYTPVETRNLFHDRYGVEVVEHVFTSSEQMLDEVRAGRTNCDIVVTADYMIPLLIEEGHLARIDASSMPSFANVQKRFADPEWDPDRSYSVPWLWGYTGISANTKFFAGPIDTWATLFDPPPALSGRINMVRELNDLIGAALLFLGLSLDCSARRDLEKVRTVLLAARPHWASFDSYTYARLKSEDIHVSQNWNGPSLRAKSHIPTVAFGAPKEGVIGWTDNAALLANAPNPANARLFLDFVMQPEGAASLSRYTWLANAIHGSEAFLPPETTAAFAVPNDVTLHFSKRRTGEDAAVVHRIWSEALG